MRTQNSARRLKAGLPSLHVGYKNALRADLPAEVTRPAEVADPGPSAVACIRTILAAQTDLAGAVLDGVERLAAKSRSARTVHGRLREEARGHTTCSAITGGGVVVELGVIETL